MNFKTEEELKQIDTLVDDDSGSWHFPHGEELLVKGKRLVKNGYTVVDYSGTQQNLTYIENKVKWCKGGGTCIFRYYHQVREYVDRKNKVYYVGFVGPHSESMWC